MATEVARAGRTARWLSTQTGIAPDVLSRKLAAQLDFTVAELADIAGALDIPVARLVPRLDES